MAGRTDCFATMESKKLIEKQIKFSTEVQKPRPKCNRMRSFCFLRLYPLDFEEFLTATGNDLLIDEITECYAQMSPMNEGLHQKALDLYHDYLIIGGMPEAVKAFIETNSYIPFYAAFLL